MALGDVDPKRVAEVREEFRALGMVEARTPEEVEAVEPTRGTVLLFVNAMDACGAELARPALAVAMQNDRVPETVVAVFAGQDLEAAAKARSYFRGYFPTAPQLGLLKDGEVVYLCDRDDLVKRLRDPDKIAQEWIAAFDEHCPPAE